MERAYVDNIQLDRLLERYGFFLPVHLNRHRYRFSLLAVCLYANIREKPWVTLKWE